MIRRVSRPSGCSQSIRFGLTTRTDGQRMDTRFGRWIAAARRPVADVHAALGIVCHQWRDARHVDLPDSESDEHPLPRTKPWLLPVLHFASRCHHFGGLCALLVADGVWKGARATAVAQGCRIRLGDLLVCLLVALLLRHHPQDEEFGEGHAADHSHGGASAACLVLFCSRRIGFVEFHRRIADQGFGSCEFWRQRVRV